MPPRASAPNEPHESAPQPTPSSASTPVHASISRQPSTSSSKRVSPPKVASRPSTVKTTPPRSSPVTSDTDDATWGSNFWVTLVDPQSQTSFYACPATGQVSWDPPVGTFVLPPSEEGEWWELADESRGGLPYYYQTKTGETVWERPAGFVIPLGILQADLQNTAAGRRLSQTTFDHYTKLIPKGKYNGSPGNKSIARTSLSIDAHNYPSTSRRHQHVPSVQLTPIPGSPNATDDSAPPSIASKRSVASESKDKLAIPQDGEYPAPRRSSQSSGSDKRRQHSASPDSSYRSQRSKSYVPQAPQSLAAAVEALSTSQSGSPPAGDTDADYRSAHEDSFLGGSSYTEHFSSEEDVPSTPMRRTRDIPPSPSRPIPDTPKNRPTVGGKGISGPILNHVATLQMSPVQNRAAGKPIPVEPRANSMRGASVATLATGTYPMLPEDLAHDIQHFSESEYAKQYFSTHRTGFIFRRKVPVAQLMTWQKSTLASPLLMLNRLLHKDAVRIFKVIQHIMGDREKERPITGARIPSDQHVSIVNSFNNSTVSLSTAAVSMLEEERWLLSEGLKHGELRDEIYCQLMKQLTGNPSAESVFKGWQLMCVLLVTFPPSKDFETYLEGFIRQHTSKPEGRVDVMAKYCLRRLSSISNKGPRGKPPSIAEIETAADAAFNPSTFGESLDAIIRLQERNYPHQQVPIILPFLADGILALGGLKSEGIFRVPGDNDTLSRLKLRIERGYYTLDGVDDPHVLASLMKLWLRELADPLVPEELYNECVEHAKDPEACMAIVERLPTINRRVVLFVVSFLQMFLEERVQSVTKMTPANMALVMAPNLLRCRSESMSVVFTNAQYEQIFVYNLLLYLECDDLDPDYKPVHGLGAVPNVPIPKKPQYRNRSRRRD